MRQVLGILVGAAMVLAGTRAEASEPDEEIIEEESRVEREVETHETTVETHRQVRRPRAEPRSLRVERREVEESGKATAVHWYGWQTLLADGASLATAFAVPAVGAAGYALGGPVVHAAHSRWAMAAADLGIRVGAPLTGVLLGSGLCGGGGSLGCAGPMLGGGVLGIVTAVTLDAALFSHETIERTTPPADGVRWSPAASARADGVDVAVRGTF